MQIQGVGAGLSIPERMPEPGIKRKAVLIGGGGHALVVAEAAEALGRVVVGFVDDDPEAVLGRRQGRRRLGGLDEWAKCVEAAGGAAAVAGAITIALGGIELRRRVIDGITVGHPAVLEQAATIVAPGARVYGSARLGAGTFVGPNAVVHSGATVGVHVIVNTGAIVEHECRIGANAHIGPGAVLGGNVEVGTDTLVGLGSRVLPGIRIGRGCTIGAGAVVVRDVPDGATVVGVPAREHVRGPVSGG